jgi:hypothetical protein
MSEPTSSAAPVHRRRRPPLSCEQCRRRKVKCDRNYPCAQCLQSKTVLCTYTPGSVGASRHVNDPASTACLPGRNSSKIPNRRRSIPSNSSKTASSAGLSPSSVRLSNTTNPSSHRSPIAPSGEYHQDERTESKVLFDRIQQLEAQLAVFKSKQTNSFSSSTPNSVPRELRGTVSKTRFFGSSHWRYSYGAVR